MSIQDEIKKRRTFAIISHPDAGKTTITEQLLYFGGEIREAGTVKGKKTGNRRRAVGKQQRQAEQAVCLLTQLRHADRDEGNDDQRNHEGQESGEQRGERREQPNDRNKSRRIRNAEPASAKADQHTGDDADNESNQQSKLFQCYILLFFIFSLSQR